MGVLASRNSISVMWRRISLSEFVEAELLVVPTSNDVFAYSVAEQVDPAFKSKNANVGKSRMETN